MTQPRYPRKFVPKPGIVATIYYYSQSAPDSKPIPHFANGTTGVSAHSVDEILALGYVEVFDHLPAEQIRYGVREPDGTRTAIVKDAGQGDESQKFVVTKYDMEPVTRQLFEDCAAEFADHMGRACKSAYERSQAEAILMPHFQLFCAGIDMTDAKKRLHAMVAEFKENRTAPAPQPASLDDDWQPFDGAFREGVEYRSRDQTLWMLYDYVEGSFPVRLERPNTGGSIKHFTENGTFYGGSIPDRWDITHQRPVRAPQPAPQGEASGTPTVERFTIRWVNEGTYCGYKVNIPNYEGGEVVTAKCFERTVAELRAEVERLRDPDKYIVPHDVQERIKELRTELAERKATARRAAQMLIEEVGAQGPENVDETAVRTVNKIKAMRERADELTARAEAAEAELNRLRNQLRIEYSRNDALARIRDAVGRIAQVFGDGIYVMPIDGELGSVQWVLNRYRELEIRVEKYEADGAECRKLALRWKRKCGSLVAALEDYNHAVELVVYRDSIDQAKAPLADAKEAT